MVAGSNPVSPTLFMQVKCYVYLLPMLTARGALDSVSTTAGSPHPDPRVNAGVTCAFCPDSDARMAATSSRRVVTRKSVDGGRVSRAHAETSR